MSLNKKSLIVFLAALVFLLPNTAILKAADQPSNSVGSTSLADTLKLFQNILNQLQASLNEIIASRSSTVSNQTIPPPLSTPLSTPLALYTPSPQFPPTSTPTPTIPPLPDQGSQHLSGLTSQIVGLARQLPSASADTRAAIVAQLASAAKERKELMKSLIKTDPQEALKLIIPDAFRSSLPPAVQGDIELQTTLQGELEAIHGDDFVNYTAQYYYTLKTTSGEKVAIHFGTADPGLFGRAKVKATGYKLDDQLLLASPSPTDLQVLEVQGATITTTPTSKKIAVILFNFQDDTSQYWSVDAARLNMFTGSASVNARYQEMSFYKMGLTGFFRPDGDIYGWYTIPYSKTSCGMFGVWTPAADAAAAANGFVPSNYDSVVYIWPKTSACTIGGIGGPGGLGTPGSALINTLAPFNDQGTIITTVHELGHSFGLSHANRYECADERGNPVPVSDNCITREYGDSFDVMGVGSGHVNNYHKGVLGWLDPANTLDITTSGTYLVAPIETPSTGIQSLRIPRAKDPAGNVTEYYYFGYHLPIGFDAYQKSASVTSNGVNGTLIRIAPDYKTPVPSLQTMAEKPQILDMTPTTAYADYQLSVGQTFSDPIAGFSITTISTSTAGAMVGVALSSPLCVHKNPTMKFSFRGLNAGASGVRVWSTVTITNNDTWPCPASTFRVTPTVPPGFTFDPNPFSVTLASGGGYATQSYSIVAPTGSAPDTYVFSGTAVNMSAPAYSTTEYNTYLIGDAAYDTIYPTASITSPVSGAVVSGIVPVTVNAADNFKVVEVDLYRYIPYQASSYALLGRAVNPPFTIFWDTTKLADATFKTFLTAYDGKWHAGGSNQFTTVTVNNGTDMIQPSVTMPSSGGVTLTNGRTISGVISVSITAKDNVKVARVEFWKDNALFGTATDCTGCSFVWDTTKDANGTHTVQGMAYDLSGNTAASAIGTVNVSNGSTGGDTTPPSAPTGLTATAVSASQINLAWNASTDNVGVTGYRVYRAGVQIAITAATNYQNTGLAANTTYSYTVAAYDAAGNVSAQSSPASAATFPASDTQPPTVSITSPPNGTTYTSSQTIPISASASDNVGVTKVEFYDNGALKGTDTVSPYTFSWSITSSQNGSHSWTAKAYDAAGNSAVSAAVNLTVSISVGDTTRPSTVTNLSAGSPTTSSLALSWTAPGDDGTSGTATSYDIRYSTSPINDSNWPSATQAVGEPFPLASGSFQSFTLSGLSCGTTYYFAIKTNDEAGNISLLSNVPFGTTSSCAPATGSIMIKRVGSDLTTATAPPGTTAQVDTGIISTNNPATFTLLSTGSHLAKATDASGLTETAGTCQYQIGAVECTISSFPIISTCNGTTCSTSVSVTSGYVTKTVFRYLAGDTQPPTVSIISPLNGATVQRRSTITIAATAFDNVGVARVEFYVNGSYTCTDTTSPYTCSWRVPNQPNKNYQLQARAYDAVGNTNASILVTVSSK